MPKKGHTEEQIIAALKQQEAGDKTADICRKLGISQATFYMWKRQYAGLGVQELRKWFLRRRWRPRGAPAAAGRASHKRRWPVTVQKPKFKARPMTPNTLTPAN